MKRFCIFMLSIFGGILMLFSCSAQPDMSSLTEGHAYIYNEETLHDLSELEYTDPGFTVDYEIPSDEELYERVINDPTMFIITFT